MQIDKSKVLKSLTKTISTFIDEVEKIPTCKLEDFNPNSTLAIMIDMVNGFCKFGALSSPNVEKLIPKMSTFLDHCIELNIPILAYQDSHTCDKAVEFDLYPPHCIRGDKESQIVEELQRKELHIELKNSTNGFLAHNPLESYKNVRDFLVIGCVTDICIKDFSVTMCKYLQEQNIRGRVYVIENLVDTFHIKDIHDRQSEHLLALYQMKSAGVKFLRY